MSNFVGLKIVRDHENKTMLIHQEEHIKQIIAKFNFSGLNIVALPADPYVRLESAVNSENPNINVPYRETVGFLMVL